MPDGRFEELLRRRDRKRRNQRITAGVVGVAVSLAVVWFVASVGPMERTRTPVVPGNSSAVQPSPPLSAVGAVPKTDYLLDLDTGEMTPLPESIVGTQNERTGEYAASPDGSRLAYVAPGDNGSRQIFVADLDGTGVEQVTMDIEAPWFSPPAWSPDGSRIAYAGHEGDDPDNLFVLDVATGTSEQLTFETWEQRDPARSRYGWKASVPSFTPDGSSVVYNVGRWDEEGTGFEHEVRIVPVAGGESVRLMGGRTDGPHAIGNARLSPDGTLLSYSCNGYSALCVANADGTDERVIVDSFDSPGDGGWSPDGARIPYSTFHAQDVYVLDFATGQVTYVAEGTVSTWLDDHTLIVEIHRCYNHATAQWGGEGCPG